MNDAEKAFDKLKEVVGTSLEAIDVCRTELTERDHEQIFSELLDDIYGEVSICGLSYSAAYAFRECDPVAFQCGLHDYLSNNAIELGESYFYEDQILDLVEKIETDKAFEELDNRRREA